MAQQINKLTPDFGAEITGLDLSKPLGGNLLADVRQTWLDAGGVLVVRDQHLTPEQHIEFSQRIGPLFGAPDEQPLQDTVSRYIHPDYPEIYRVSNKVVDGEPQGRAKAGTYWHSDVSFRDRPASASILYAKEIPAVGGDTLFADQARAYEALTEGMKDLLAPLQAYHDFAVAAATQYARPIVVEGDFDGANRTIHPVVRTHGETGRKSLYVNPGFTAGLVDFDPAESQVLLGFLFAHCIRPEFVYHHKWQPNDLLMWDNRSLMHYAISDYGDEPRYLERTTVIGEKPV